MIEREFGAPRDLGAMLGVLSRGAGDPAYQELKAKLAGMLIAHFRERGAEAPFDGDFFRLYPQPVLPEGRDAILLSQDPPSTLPHIPGYERDCVIKPNPNIR